MASNVYPCERGEHLDEQEREKLILENLPLVHWIASRLHESLPPSIPLEDLVSTGIVGLIAAIDNFDPRYNVKLGSYAHHRIRGAMLDSIRGLDGISGPNRQRMKKVEASDLGGRAAPPPGGRRRGNRRRAGPAAGGIPAVARRCAGP